MSQFLYTLKIPVRNITKSWTFRNKHQPSEEFWASFDQEHVEGSLGVLAGPPARRGLGRRPLQISLLQQKG